MSDNDDIEVESDADKRAHHNALERKRRDHIKDSFHSLRDSVPSLQGEKGTKMKLTLPPVFPYEHLPLPTVFCHG
ncbi:protein max isoform X8 [Papio anubis]|uniref:protein max isoform X7 n=1 Tax=Cercocebus atys TaxID=9531 RepID=UPI0005F506AF|nr:PREDICTED: protein max isoform X7 [Cercocebus atys]XP_031523912.1 protein max isoform X8 [Papio anubis]